MFDIMVKRVDESKRQLMNLIFVILIYNYLKTITDYSKVLIQSA